MKQPFLIFMLLLATCFYLGNSALKISTLGPGAASESGPLAQTAPAIVVASSSTYYHWKTGPQAQNDWKTGDNAQTNFEPFAPNEQDGWNQSPGYTIVSGAKIRR
ncbi:MAG: hypothetical protein H0X40_06440 [Chthoniobacterales bacterium]|nr:hypothetical protein [Chthoniobacterales bacterium]